MDIPFLSLKKVNLRYQVEFQESFLEFVDIGHYILGPQVKAFEANFAEYCQSKYCIGVANGLDALELIIKSYKFPSNSEIIVPANTYYASILSIINVGLKPVLVEPKAYDLLLDTTNLETHITPKTVAILGVNLYGRMCDLSRLKSICTDRNLKLFVDAAQSHGALYNGTTNCIGADATAYSFYPTKNLGALSDAGAVITDDIDLANEIRKNRNYGSEIKYKFDGLGRNSRLSELQAGFLNIKLKYLNEEINIRRDIARKYLNEIKNPRIILPPNDNINEDAWHLFVIRCKNRKSLAQYLEKMQIGYEIHYPIPPHKQKAFSGFGDFELPITEEIHETILSLPLNPSLNQNEIDYIIKILNEFEYA
ncbi:DegT/DnrJ/EryC1/StrS family aminotransferase [Lacihabitans sp. LS3-19]|uniref:DegT/DnrJ/EryC1/StrS family aminotransferase n=1 Tax=Lacihabitans sp. LS3-19 TaxID=2487335 RepID=UPI0020CBF3C3|nr:DegT/DnrJ/EryC1/StrS family aminotransferase [Lacihabitans sp. LS3-19]MCP9767712.1 DegT/DnrJ/EryC1/StrS family aminotransferase [Lacihabitans sp. LS3-19]